MNQNKTTKYLKYAIGEIVLVVIGILIALSLNNWNEERKDRKEELVIINKILEEIELNLVYTDSLVNFHNARISAAQQLLIYTKKPSNSVDGFTLDSLLLYASIYNPFTAKNEHLNRILESSKIDLIRSERLQVKLLKYNSSLRESIFLSRSLMEHVNNRVFPFFNKHYPLRNLIRTYPGINIPSGSHDIEPIVLLSNLEFENIIIGIIAYNNNLLALLHDNLSKMESIKNTIKGGYLK